MFTSRQAGALAVSGVHLLGKVPAHCLQPQHVTHAILHADLDDLIVEKDLEGHERSLPARCLRMCLVGARVPGHTGGVEVRTARVTSSCLPWTSLVYGAWCCRGCCGCCRYCGCGFGCCGDCGGYCCCGSGCGFCLARRWWRMLLGVAAARVSLLRVVLAAVENEDNEKRTRGGGRGAALAFAIWRSPSTPT